MADESDILIREINDELREEQFKKLWKRYGNLISAVAVAIVVTVAGYQGWTSYDTGKRQTDGEHFDAALRLSESGQHTAAIEALETLVQDGSAGYPMLARFRQAALSAQSGDLETAVRHYGALSAEGGLDPLYRDLARLLGAWVQMEMGVVASELSAQLTPLTLDDNPWRFSAHETLAVLALRQGDKETARTHLQTLKDATATPRGIRDRSNKMLEML